MYFWLGGMNVLHAPLYSHRAGVWSSAIVTGHAYFDALWWLVTSIRLRMSHDASLILHHACVWLFFPVFAYYNHAAVMCLLILHEGSSPLIACRAVLLCLGVNRAARPYTALMLLLLPVFLLCHDAVNVAVLLLCVRERALLWSLPWPLRGSLLVCVLLLTALSTLWSVVLCVRTRSTWQRYRTAKLMEKG